MQHLKYLAMNLVLKAGKNLQRQPPWAKWLQFLHNHPSLTVGGRLENLVAARKIV